MDFFVLRLQNLDKVRDYKFPLMQIISGSFPQIHKCCGGLSQSLSDTHHHVKKAIWKGTGESSIFGLINTDFLLIFSLLRLFSFEIASTFSVEVLADLPGLSMYYERA